MHQHQSVPQLSQHYLNLSLGKVPSARGNQLHHNAENNGGLPLQSSYTTNTVKLRPDFLKGWIALSIGYHIYRCISQPFLQCSCKNARNIINVYHFTLLGQEKSWSKDLSKRSPVMNNKVVKVVPLFCCSIFNVTFSCLRRPFSF